MRRAKRTWITEWDVACPKCEAGQGRYCLRGPRRSCGPKFHRARKRIARAQTRQFATRGRA